MLRLERINIETLETLKKLVNAVRRQPAGSGVLVKQPRPSMR